MGTHRQTSSFKGMYAILYWSYSGTAHPSYIGLNPVVEDVTDIRKRVIVEKRPEGRGPVGMATVVYALGVYVAGQCLGWPDANRVTAAFDRYPVLM